MWGVLARVEKWVCCHQICLSGCDLAAQWPWQDVCPQSRRWLQDQRPSQILRRAMTPRAPLTSDGWSVCVTASAPSPPASLLATSSPCCCCCSTQDRSAEMSISVRSAWWDPLHNTLSHSPSASRSHWRTALYMTLRSPLEREMCWESWVWLYSQKMRSVVGHS